jgi:hypothetical protein
MLRQAHTWIPLALGLCLTAGAAGAACPTAPFFIDLKSGVVGTLGGPNAQVTVSGFINSPAAGCAGWKEAVLKINLAGCTRANLVAEYEGLPRAWTLDLGDSPTNDGYAGDAGSTPNNAEMWILDETLAVANAGNNPAVINNPILFQHVSLTDSAMKFVVKNQYLSWGQPYGYLQTPATHELFAIPDNASADGSNIYAGLNRVIFNAPANGRRGCGLRRVLVTLQ